MKRVLFIAYYFPPIGGAGVQRSVKFARYLPESDYQPIIVTGPGTATGRWTPRDGTLAGELPTDAEIVRVPGPEPEPPVGWEGRLERWANVKAAWSRWWIEGVVASAIAQRGIDVIFASMSPFESSVSAARLSRFLGVPWVADLRDPWALDEMLVYPTGLHRRLELQEMNRLLRSAAAIVMNTPEAAEQLRRTFPELPGSIVTIPNGFDASDFAGPVPPRDVHAFQIVHTGYLHTSAGRPTLTASLRRRLGGTLDHVDIATRSHIYLLEAVRRLLRRSPQLRDELEIHFAGALTHDDERELDLEVVHTHGYVDHAQTIALMVSADLLFLPMHDLPEGRRARIVPGKTYEYLAAARPILAAVPDGDARDLLTSAGNAFLCRPRDVEAMMTIIDERIAEWRRGEANGGAPDPSVLALYERRHLTQELAQVFDRVTRSASGG